MRFVRRMLAIGSLVACPGLAPAASKTHVLSVGTAKGVPGQIARGTLTVGEAADGSAVALPLAIVTGSSPGPVVWVDAGAHGDEYGGPRALQDVVGSLDPKTMSGTLVAIFSANPNALRGLQRAPESDRRAKSFPKRSVGWQFQTELPRISWSELRQTCVVSNFLDARRELLKSSTLAIFVTKPYFTVSRSRRA